MSNEQIVEQSPSTGGSYMKDQETGEIIQIDAPTQDNPAGNKPVPAETEQET